MKTIVINIWPISKWNMMFVIENEMDMMRNIDSIAFNWDLVYHF